MQERKQVTYSVTKADVTINFWVGLDLAYGEVLILIIITTIIIIVQYNIRLFLSEAAN